MGADQEARTWATDLLLDFTERFIPEGHELSALRAAGASNQQAAILYPVSPLGWLGGILDLTHDAELAPGHPAALARNLTPEQAAVRIIEESWQFGRTLAADLHPAHRTLDMGNAWSSATDPDEINFTPHVLHFELLLLQALACGEAQPNVGWLQQASWTEALAGYRSALSSLAKLLRERNWVCSAQRKQQAT